MTVLYEDNHVIIVSKEAGEIVQGDKTGDKTLADSVKAYLKEKYNKPGEVFLGTTHRLDRPTSGIVIFAKTSKALTRLNEMFRRGSIHKTYLAVTEYAPEQPQARLTHWLVRNEKQNKSYAHDRLVPKAKEATLEYRLVSRSDRYTLLQVKLLTGRHHQIRSQLSHIGCVIKGDLKYGARRSNADGSICLHAWHISFEHPVSHITVSITAPVPKGEPWHSLMSKAEGVSES